MNQDLAGRLLKAGLLTAAALVASATVALASNAVRGASYLGHFTGGATAAISFKVSANGSRLTELSVDTPIKCGGGCGGIPSGRAASVRIRNGKFKVIVKLLALGSSSKVIGTDTVTGTFLKHGGARGTITSHFNSGGGGRSESWTATG